MFGPKTTTPGMEPPQPAVPVTGVPGGPGLGDQPDVHVLDRLHVIYKYRKAMITIVVLVLVAGILQTYTTTPAYMGVALVRAEVEGPQIAATAEAQQMLAPTDPEAFMLTELTIINSRDLKLAVVRRLRLDQDESFLAPAGPQGLEGMLAARVVNPVRSFVGSWFSSPEPAAPPASAAPVTPAKKADSPLAPIVPETPQESRAVDTLAGNLAIGSEPDTRIFTIRYSSPSPERAAAIANTFAELYVERNIERRRKTINDQLVTLTQRIEESQAEIDAASRNLLQRSTDSQVVDPAMAQTYVAEARRELSRADNELAAKRITMENLDLLDPDRDLESALNHPEIIGLVGTLRSTLSDLQTQKDNLLARGVGVMHDTVRQLDQRIAKAREDMRAIVIRQQDAARKAYQIAEQQRRTAEVYFRTQERIANDSSRASIPLSDLRERLTADRTNYQNMLAQRSQLDILARGITNNLSIADRAPVPSRPYKPETSRNILLSLAVGVALALGLAFGLDYLDDTIKTPEDVTRKLHVPFLGLVPAVRGDKQPVLSGPVPHDFGEAYRALRTSLVFTSGGESTRIITVTSAQPLEGKTTTACNLAMVLSFGGSRVLLIDADMRRPGVHKTLKMNNTVGLSHLLVGQARVREAIQRTSDPNFCVMTAGRTPPNPSELLSSERMKQLIANLKQGPFDWVVIDTPPVLAVTDAVILTPLVDGVTFVLGAEMTRRRLAERAVQMIVASRPRVVGGILNRVNFDRNKYYYSRYYGYQYKSYYGAAEGTTGSTKA